MERDKKKLEELSKDFKKKYKQLDFTKSSILGNHLGYSSNCSHSFQLKHNTFINGITVIADCSIGDIGFSLGSTKHYFSDNKIDVYKEILIISNEIEQYLSKIKISIQEVTKNATSM